MKNSILIIPFFFISLHSYTQNQGWRREVKNFREKLEWEYMHEERTPLTEEDKSHFKGLDYYKPAKKWRVEATLVLTPDSLPFDLMTSSGKTKRYVQYGWLEFRLLDQDLKLAVYQSETLKQDPIYQNYLFLPFADHTNGLTTYGGGRYIDMEIPESGSKVVLDFNQCYNPYCAYSTGWNCPLVPEVNHLPIEIEAGVKKWHD